jgi:hypothetical protein
MDKRILYSGMLTPDGTLLESLYRHDYQCHDDKNGKHYLLDGGNDYIRSSMNLDERFITLYNTDPWELIRKFKKRLNNRINKWVTFENIDDEWLDNIIDWYMDEIEIIWSISPGVKSTEDAFILYLKEKQYRNVETEIF